MVLVSSGFVAVRVIGWSWSRRSVSVSVGTDNSVTYSQLQSLLLPPHTLFAQEPSRSSQKRAGTDWRERPEMKTRLTSAPDE